MKHDTAISTEANSSLWKSDAAYRIRTQNQAIDDAKFVGSNEWKIVCGSRVVRRGKC